MTTIKALSLSDKSLLVSSYGISDIYDICIALLKFGKNQSQKQGKLTILAKTRHCRNISFSLEAQTGKVEVKDDGDPIDLGELGASSVFLKRKFKSFKFDCYFSRSSYNCQL